MSASSLGVSGPWRSTVASAAAAVGESSVPPAPAAASWRSLLAVRTIAIRNRAAASVSLFSCVVVVI